MRGETRARDSAERSGAPSSELQALLDAAVDAIVLIDHRGCVQTFNRAAERLFGYGAAEVLGRNVSILMTEEDRRSHDAYMARYRQTGIPHIIGIGREVTARRKDGTVFQAFLSVGEIAGSEPPRFVGFLQDITLREQAVAAMQRERDRANRYLDVAETMLLALDAEGRVQMLNRKGCEILGVEQEELIGRDWLEAAVPAQERAAACAALTEMRSIAGDDTRYGEYRVCTADGQLRLIAWRCRALRDPAGKVTGLLCSGEDITERRAIEQSVERTRTLLEEAQSIAHIGNYEYYLPPRGDDYWSPEARRILDIEPGRGPFGHEQLAPLIHPDDRARCEEQWSRSLRAPGTHSLECRIVRRDGEARDVLSRYQVSTDPDGRTRIAGTLLDVTEVKRTEEQARLAQERMTHVSRLATMGEMAAGIAHELNQPLAAIATYAQACQRLLSAGEPDLPEARGALEQIAGQALRAGEIIRRLRSLVGNRQIERAPADVNELIQELGALIRTDARLHDVRLVLDFAPGLAPVNVDRIQIQQVVLNLVRNAIEALEEIPAGQREITLATGSIGAGEIEIRVSDTGPGVDAALGERIFDPFCTSKPTGTGLGLAISQTIVNAHQGTLGYRANEPTGACFFVRLPASSGDPT